MFLLHSRHCCVDLLVILLQLLCLVAHLFLFQLQLFPARLVRRQLGSELGDCRIQRGQLLRQTLKRGVHNLAVRLLLVKFCPELLDILQENSVLLVRCLIHALVTGQLRAHDLVLDADLLRLAAVFLQLFGVSLQRSSQIFDLFLKLPDAVLSVVLQIPDVFFHQSHPVLQALSRVGHGLQLRFQRGHLIPNLLQNPLGRVELAVRDPFLNQRRLMLLALQVLLGDHVVGCGRLEIVQLGLLLGAVPLLSFHILFQLAQLLQFQEKTATLRCRASRERARRIIDITILGH
mmetsp:Transcript_47007/g.124918  ORF Transcript_47007/g.124918 Transcript_47007/m.124918 type:complete len:290 (-) Transcript_47007:2056-2925(-)